MPPIFGSSLRSATGRGVSRQGPLRGPQTQGPSTGAPGGGKSVQKQTPKKAMRAGQGAVGWAAVAWSHGDTGRAGGGGVFAVSPHSTPRSADGGFATSLDCPAHVDTRFVCAAAPLGVYVCKIPCVFAVQDRVCVCVCERERVFECALQGRLACERALVCARARHVCAQIGRAHV